MRPSKRKRFPTSELFVISIMQEDVYVPQVYQLKSGRSNHYVIAPVRTTTKLSPIKSNLNLNLKMFSKKRVFSWF